MVDYTTEQVREYMEVSAKLALARMYPHIPDYRRPKNCSELLRRARAVPNELRGKSFDDGITFLEVLVKSGLTTPKGRVKWMNELSRFLPIENIRFPTTNPQD